MFSINFAREKKRALAVYPRESRHARIARVSGVSARRAGLGVGLRARGPRPAPRARRPPRGGVSCSRDAGASCKKLILNKDKRATRNIQRIREPEGDLNRKRAVRLVADRPWMWLVPGSSRRFTPEIAFTCRALMRALFRGSRPPAQAEPSPQPMPRRPQPPC